ncbi:MAG: serine hydrolase [Patescibacteria group bacterium]|nr:serine hydrolase [Patescibacteria group bacterium]MDD5490222.1 serine hydrolase [Patescibacteria group bacterium]
MLANLIINLFVALTIGQSFSGPGEIILPAKAAAPAAAEESAQNEAVKNVSENLTGEPTSEGTIRTPERINLESKSLGVKITAQSVVVVDGATGKVLYQNNDSAVRSIASITKLITVLVFLDNNPGWDKEIIFNEEDKSEGSTDYLYVGESVKVRDLFYLSLMMSNNSATTALVRSTGLGRSEFVSLMNKKAEEFGMADTRFVDIVGFDDFNISTARDIAKLASVAFANSDIREATTPERYTIHTLNTNRYFYIYNTNYLLTSFLNEGDYRVAAGKTGYTNAAGYCLATEIEKNGAGNIITVVLGSDSLDNRFQDTKALAYWVFSNYEWR